MRWAPRETVAASTLRRSGLSLTKGLSLRPPTLEPPDRRPPPRALQPASVSGSCQRSGRWVLPGGITVASRSRNAVGARRKATDNQVCALLPVHAP